MTVYVDDAFVDGDWGRWTGGGHLMADTDDELHAFAECLGLKRQWAQLRPAMPWRNHYDLTRSKRRLAIERGAVSEDCIDFGRRMRARREAAEGG